MDKTELILLIRQLLAGTLSAAEQARLKEWVLDATHRQTFVDIVDELTAGQPAEQGIRERDWLPLIHAATHADLPPQRQSPVKWMWVRYAAAAILCLAVAGLWLHYSKRDAGPGLAVHQTPPVRDVQPGHNGAVLTLADGKTIQLDSAANGTIARQEATEIRLQNGQLAYREGGKIPSGGSAHGPLLWNTITTPAGRQFHLLLPDGTQVWLNAGSSLHYPVAFNGNERKVEVRGEVYFEVAKNKEKPFRVQINDTNTVEVLGTRFDVNAYADEPVIRTTLLEGSVRVDNTKAKERLLLAPGEQAVISPGANASLKKMHVDTDNAVAWKSGLFSFTNADLRTVMRQLARWYNVRVDYKGAIPDMRFDGKIDQSLTLVQVLDGLTKKRLNYTIEGTDYIIIYP